MKSKEIEKQKNNRFKAINLIMKNSNYLMHQASYESFLNCDTGTIMYINKFDGRKVVAVDFFEGRLAWSKNIPVKEKNYIKDSLIAAFWKEIEKSSNKKYIN